MQQGKPDPSPCPCNDPNPLLQTTLQAAPNADPWSPLQVDCRRGWTWNWAVIANLIFSVQRWRLLRISSLPLSLLMKRWKNNIDNSEVQFVQKWRLICHRNKTKDKWKREIHSKTNNRKKIAKDLKKYFFFYWVDLSGFSNFCFSQEAHDVNTNPK